MSSNSTTYQSFTTVCIDIYGRIYDLSKEHPSWEQIKAARRKSPDGVVNESQLKCIVANAFSCTEERCQELKEKYT